MLDSGEFDVLGPYCLLYRELGRAGESHHARFLVEEVRVLGGPGHEAR